MPSPAQLHRQRILAARATARAAEDGDASLSGGSAYELMLAKLAEDKRVLKDIKSIEQKIAVKRQRLPEYIAWIRGVLEADQPVQDDVFATLMVWSIDTGAIDQALTMAEHLLKHDLRLPEHYQRDLPTLVVEEIAERTGLPDGGNVTVDDLLRVGALTQDRDMPDEVRAKLHRAIGLALRTISPPQALDHLQRALQLNPRLGLKTEIAKLTKQLASAT
ncbi:phage terminase small subunit [Dyella sp. 2RAB6]|uniref:phage terminase small subunit n=1 Tax=Dyella sp. 2RAB6 TaxID=3232992 RepID=UPI003F8FE66F